MYEIFYILLQIIWLMDILNFPFMRALDVTYPINTITWLIIWIIVSSVGSNSGGK